MTVLTTERLVLRDWTADPADLARIFDIYSPPGGHPLAGRAPGLPMTDPAQAAERLAAWRERHAGARRPVRHLGDRGARHRRGGRHGAAQAAARAGRGGADRGHRGGLAPAPRLVGPRVRHRGGPGGWWSGSSPPAPGRSTRWWRRATTASMAVARRLGMTHVGRRTDWYGGESLETFVLTVAGDGSRSTQPACSASRSCGNRGTFPSRSPRASGEARQYSYVDLDVVEFGPAAPVGEAQRVPAGVQGDVDRACRQFPSRCWE